MKDNEKIGIALIIGILFVIYMFGIYIPQRMHDFYIEEQQAEKLSIISFNDNMSEIQKIQVINTACDYYISEYNSGWGGNAKSCKTDLIDKLINIKY